MSDDDLAGYAEHRSRKEMQELLHHGHWVPALRGRTAAYVAAHFPGWSWDDLVRMCRAAGIVEQVEPGAPLRCDRRVRSFHFTDADTFAVRWVDGTVTTSDRRGD